ncbi:MAG: hypothetical protein ACI9QD_000524 [Thermoproteota archaeon]|jgi:hypothetical protein
MRRVFKFLIFVSLTMFVSQSILADEFKVISHEVKLGESLMTISNRYYNTHQKWQEILAVNPEVTPTDLSVGDTIKVRVKESFVQAQFGPKVKEVIEKEVEIDHEELVVKKKIIKKQVVVKAVVKVPVVKKRIVKTVSLADKRYKELLIENAKLRQFNAKFQNKIHSLSSSAKNSNTRDNEWKSKYEGLQDDFLELKEEKVSNNSELEKFYLLKKKYDKSQDDLDDAKSDIKGLAHKVSSLERQNYSNKKYNPLYVRSILAKSQEQILKEKMRILTEKLWVNKNKDFGKCSVTLNQEHSKDVKKSFRNFVLYLNEEFGSDNVLISQSERKIIFKLPGKMVYGVKSPKVNQRFKKQLLDLGNYFAELPIDQINIIGQSKYQTVRDNHERKFDATSFSLGQAMTLQDYFVDELGVPTRKLSTSSYGFRPGVDGKSEKFFEVQLSLNGFDNKKKGRHLASVIQKDEALTQIYDELLTKLGEPKYSQIDIKEDALEINLGKHYFFKDSNHQLTTSGKRYFDNLMNMFALTTETNFEITWIPGKTDTDKEKNKTRAIREIASIKNYLDSSHSWVKGRMVYGFSNRHHTLKDGISWREDRYNKRLVFKVKPTSINIMSMDEIK